MKIVFEIIEYARTFYKLIGPILFLLFALIIFSGFIEMIGLSMLMPILSLATNTPSNDPFTNKLSEICTYFEISPSLGLLLAMLVLIFITKAILIFSHRLLASIIQMNIHKKLQIQFTELFGNMNYSHYSGVTTGVLNNLIIREVPRFLQGFMEFTRMPVTLVYIIVYVSMASLLHFHLTLALLGAGVVTILLTRILIIKTISLSIDVTENAGILQNSLVEFIQNFTYLKATATGNKYISKLKERISQFAKLEYKVTLMTSLLLAIKEPIAIVFLAAMIFYQVEIKGNVLNEVLILGLLLYRLIYYVLQLQAEWQRFNSCIGGVIAVPLEIENLNREAELNGEKELDNLEKTISFNNVSAAHDDVIVLSDVNIEIKKNENIGIVGPSGAGKTTFFYLLTGLMEPSQGDITIGGENYKEFDKKSIRKNIGYVTQEPVIINDTIAKNISLWSPAYEEKEGLDKIKKAMDLANFGKFYENINLHLGERGIRLSGGEKQRIAIARELFKEPSLLIFDEATSALDSRSEEIIQDSIKKMHGKCTIVLIAHRLSTVRNCDRIYVFNNGKIEGAGNFEELYNENAVFKDMCNKQHLTL